MHLDFILAILLSVPGVSHSAISQLRHLMLSCNTHIPVWFLPEPPFIQRRCTSATVRHRLFKYCPLFKWFGIFTEAMSGTGATADQRATP